MSSTPFLVPHSFPSGERLSGPAINWPILFRAWLPVAFFACVFAIESQAAFGADHTSQPLHDFSQAIFGQSINHNWSETHHLIRKTGHFLGYGTLSLALFRGGWLTLRSRLNTQRLLLASHALAIAGTFLFASLDELHQSFLPNRTGLFSDVLLDTAGAATLQLALFVTLQTIAHWPSPAAAQTEAAPELKRAA